MGSSTSVDFPPRVGRPPNRERPPAEVGAGGRPETARDQGCRGSPGPCAIRRRRTPLLARQQFDCRVHVRRTIPGFLPIGGAGRLVGIPGAPPDSCPVRALRAWLRCAGLTDGPLFRGVNRHGTVQPGRLTAQAVALVVKRRAAAAGLEPEQFAGHSLRGGLATSAAAAAGASERSIMKQTGHRSERVAWRYIRAGALFRENAAAGLV